MDTKLYSDVFCYIDESDKYEALSKVISSCSIFSTLPVSKEEFESAVINREKLQSTDIGHGVAIAHGKISGLDSTKIALGFSKKGIVFKSNSFPVHLLFVIASPLGNDSNYLKSVASLLSWIHDPVFREKLEKLEDCVDQECFFEMLHSQHYTLKLK